MGIVYYNIHYGTVAQCHTKMANNSVLLVYQYLTVMSHYRASTGPVLGQYQNGTV